MGLSGSAQAALARALAELERWGVLLQADATLPSVSRIVTGEAIRGSWWAHPRAHAIAEVSFALAQRSDVLWTKLVSGKVTYVYRSRWADLFAVACALDPWQVRGLSRLARSLLKRVEARGLLRSDQLKDGQRTGRAQADAARELERRLLIHSQDVHTESGAHARALEAWKRTRRRLGWKGRVPASQVARKHFEELGVEWEGRFGVPVLFPWTDKVN